MAEQRYRVIERLEAGGMAEVFLGEAQGAQGFKKRVAIKRVLPHLAQNKRFISMFLDEARLGARLNHANIVTCFDIGAADNTYFIVMEFVDGANLKTIMETVRKQGKFVPVKEAVFICMEACRGLSYAHELTDDDGNPLHIVHRDISPPNIMITKRGEVKVADFGLAKASTQLEKTDPGVVKGKFSYLSPEAAQGVDVDARADVFAMGIVLWEMIAGKRLFLGETDYQTVKLVSDARIPSLRPMNSGVDADFEVVLHKCLARDPKDRYQSAAELGDALAGYLFSHQLKVTSYDIANLVNSVLSEKAKTKEPKKADQSIIDRLIQEELLRFTSLDELSDPLNPGAAPLTDDDVDGGKPLDMRSFENPADWFSNDDEVKSAVDNASIAPKSNIPRWREGGLASEHPDAEPGDLAAMLESEESVHSLPPVNPMMSRPPRKPSPVSDIPPEYINKPLPAPTKLPSEADDLKPKTGLYVAIGVALFVAAGALAWFAGVIGH
ncbi:MAG: serine/threonine protein kinase [Sandaracinaceae bacterium]|nr:serine/threonine protein kinase [Sandaracinaceae bacterium]